MFKMEILHGLKSVKLVTDGDPEDSSAIEKIREELRSTTRNFVGNYSFYFQILPLKSDLFEQTAPQSEVNSHFYKILGLKKAVIQIDKECQRSLRAAKILQNIYDGMKIPNIVVLSESDALLALAEDRVQSPHIEFPLQRFDKDQG